MALPSVYDPKVYEALIYERWMKSQVGNPETQIEVQSIDSERAQHYCVLMPPPNLTGTLHAGHAFQHYIMDSLSRKARQEGVITLWYPGVDHAGIQLEGIIDKLINEGEFNDSIQKTHISIPSDTPQSEYAKWLKANNREFWLECAWQKVNEWRDIQKNQAKILGDTPDYSRSLFTLDERASRMVYYAFEKYWEDGLIYKGEYMINWSVGLQTALSDFQQDVEWVEQQDPFVTFEYTLESAKRLSSHDSNSFEVLLEEVIRSYLSELRVSTVRPETIFADVAIALNPQKLYEITENHPLTDELVSGLNNNEIEITYEIPVLSVKNVKLILSDRADLSFGTGALKITPAHDQADFEIFNEFVEKGLLTQSYQSAIGRDGKMTYLAGEFEGLPVLSARMLIIKRLIESGHVPIIDSNDTPPPHEYLSDDAFSTLNYNDKIKALKSSYPIYTVDWEYNHNVLYCERSKTRIEPFVSTEFFLSYKNKSKGVGKSLQEIGLDGLSQTQFYPDEVYQRAEKIIQGLHDWCISRSLVWGHRIPVWYNEELNPHHAFYSFDQHQSVVEVIKDGQKFFHKAYELFHVGREKPDRPGTWVQEEKVLDTWFGSCLWPLTTLDFYDTLQGNEDTDFSLFYPTNVLVTATDILYAWVVRMIIVCTYWTGKTPFREVVINPTVLDEKGKKMSKSLKNGLNPDEAITKFSSDSLRLSVFSGMIPGRNMRLGGRLTDELCEKYRNFGNKLWNIARFFENKGL